MTACVCQCIHSCWPCLCCPRSLSFLRCFRTTHITSLAHFANEKRDLESIAINQYEPANRAQKSRFPSCKHRLWLVACSVFGFVNIWVTTQFIHPIFHDMSHNIPIYLKYVYVYITLQFPPASW